MKLVKSLLLGSAAGLAAVASAQAADLPFRKAAPVDYVRVCDWVGQAGYFYIPGTDTCIRVGGEVRFEYGFIQPENSFASTKGGFGAVVPGNFPALNSYVGTFNPSRLRNTSGFLGRGQIEVDARTQTAYGLLRAFVRLQGNVTAGNEGGIFANGNAYGTVIDKAYITFAGVTAGRVQSFFDLYADNYNYGAIANSDQSTEVLAYTATFGGGFSATVAAENPNERRDGIGSIYFGNTAIGLQSQVAYGANVGYGGLRYPDAVAQLRYEQAWGAIQLSGAFHDVTTSTTGSVDAVNVSQFRSSDEAGFAVQAGIDVKLPMIAAGDELFLEGAYQNGAYLYQDAAANISFNGLVGGFQHQDADAIAVGIPGTTGYRLALSEGFSVMGAFHHYFTPQFHDVLFGSYEEVGYGNTVKNIDWTRGGVGDASQYKIGNQFIFTPAHNLDFGVEVLYTKVDQDLAHERGVAPTALPAGVKLNPDSFQVRLRVNRDF